MNKILLLSIFLVLGFAFAQESSGFVEEDAHVHGAALLNIAQEADALFVEFISPAFNIVGFEYQPSSDEEKKMVADALTDLEQGMMLFAPNASAACTLVSVSVESEIAEDGHDHHEHGEEEHHDGEHGDEHGEEGHHDEDKDHDGEHAEGEHSEDGHDEHAEGEEHGEEGEHHEGEHAEGEEHHDEHGEEGHHDEDKEHAEGEDHDHDHEEGEVHSEFHGSYEFTCSNAEELSSLDLKGLFIFYPAIEDLDVQYALESGQGAAELNAENSMLNF